MIKSSFIKKQIAKAAKQKQTPKLLKVITFSVVDAMLKRHYPTTYPMKCLQSSIGVNIVLNAFGIKSQAIIGEVCVPQVFLNDSDMGAWNGFGGMIIMCGLVRNLVSLLILQFDICIFTQLQRSWISSQCLQYGGKIQLNGLTQ